MFKKKPPLPARPEPPTFEQIQEDIISAPENDVAFHFSLNEAEASSETSQITIDSSKKISNGQVKEENIGSEEDDDEGGDEEDDDSHPEIAFRKVKTFVEVNESLQAAMDKLKQECEMLMASGHNLNEEAKQVKAQNADLLR